MEDSVFVSVLRWLISTAYLALCTENTVLLACHFKYHKIKNKLSHHNIKNKKDKKNNKLSKKKKKGDCTDSSVLWNNEANNGLE